MITNLQEIIDAADIIDIIGRRITIKKTGTSYKARCPFHKGGQEKRPSFSISPDRNLWKCWSCGVGGSAVDFLCRYEQLEFLEAVELLAGETGIDILRDHDQTRPSGPSRSDLHAACTSAALHYHNNLRHSKRAEPARQYITERGLEPLIETGNLGYAIGNSVSDCGIDPDTLIAAGILVQPADTSRSDTPYDPMSGRLVIPLHNPAGRVVGFTGRLIPTTDKKPTTQPKYRNTAETPIYHKGDQLYGYHTAVAIIRHNNHPPIIMEGQLKALAAQHAGYPAVAPGGTAITDQQIRLLSRLSDTIHIAMDDDDAGQAATLKLLTTIYAIDGPTPLIQRLIIPDAAPAGTRDPDDLLAAGLPITYTDPISPVNWLADTYLTPHQQYTPHWTTALQNTILQLITNIPNPLTRDSAICELSTRTGLSIDTLRRSQPAARTAHQPQKQIDTPPPEINKAMTPSAYLLSIILQLPLDDWNNWQTEVDWINIPKRLVGNLRMAGHARQYAIENAMDTITAIRVTPHIPDHHKDQLTYWATADLAAAPSIGGVISCLEHIRSDNT